MFQQHLTSKGHMAAAKRHGILDDTLKQLKSVVAASSIPAQQEETETHAQRLARFQQVWQWQLAADSARLLWSSDLLSAE
jgi:hypothetical protein